MKRLHIMIKTPKIILFACLLCLALASCSLPGQTATATPSAVPTTLPTLPPATATVEPSATAEIPSPTPTSAAEVFHLSEIHMLDAQNGWGVGTRGTQTNPEVARTTDGGMTWTSVTPPDAERAPDSHATAFFLDDQHAWVTITAQPNPALVGATIFRTTDGGATWQGTEIDGSGLMMEFFYPGQIGFFDAQNGWFVVHLGVGMNHDYVAVATTADGGASWKYVVDPAKGNLWMSCQKNDIWFRDAQNAYAVGTCNGVMAGLYFYVTPDGGETWNEANLPPPADGPDVYTNEMSMCEGTDLRFTDAQNGRLLVRCTDMNDMQARRWLYRTQDGGQTWTSTLMPAPLGEVYFLNDELGWYVSPPAPDSTVGTKVFSTQDGGTTWEELAAVDWSGPASFSDAQNGWIAGASQIGKALLHTSDGGAAWAQVPAVIMR